MGNDGEVTSRQELQVFHTGPLEKARRESKRKGQIRLGEKKEKKKKGGKLLYTIEFT